MDEFYENVDDNNPGRERKDLVVFDEMIPDIIRNKTF